MSDLKSDFSDETDGSDFSASEDDWKPKKSELIGASGSDDSDFEDVPEVLNSKKGKSGPLSTKKPKIITTKRTVKPVRNTRSLRSTASPQPSSSNGLTENLKASSYENNLSSSSSENSDDEDLVDVKNSNKKSSYVPKPQYWSTFEDKEEFDAPPKSEYKFENLKVIEQYEKTKECFNSYKKSECTPKVDLIQSNDDGDDISKLLAMGEKSTASSSSSKVQKSGKSSNSQPKHKVRRDSESDWEEVQDGDKQHQLKQHQYKGDIQVTVELPQYQKLKKKNAEEIEASLKRRINRVIKENQLNLHKVSFLCHLANGIYTNKILNDSRLMSETIKLLPNDKYCYPNGPTDMKYFGSFIKWYKNTMSLKYDGMYSNFRKRPPLQKSLALQIKCKSAICKKDYVLIFIVLLRAMGIQCRLVVNLVTLPIKPLQNDLCSLKQKSPNDKKKSESDEKQVVNTKKTNKHDNSSKNSTRSSKTENLDDLEEDIGKKQNLKKKLEKKALPSTSRSHNSKSSPQKNSNEKNMEKSKQDSINNDNIKVLADKVKDTKSKLKLDSNSKVEPINEQNAVRRTTRSKGKNTLKRTNSPENEKPLEEAKKPKQSSDQITENKNRQRNKRACQTSLKDNPVETDEKSRKRMKKNDDSEKQKQITSKRLVKSKTSIPQMDGADDMSTTKSSKNKTKKSSAKNRGSKKKQIDLKKLESSSKEQNDSADEFTLSFKNKVPLTKSKLSSKLLENVKRSDRRVLSTDDDEPDSSGGDENKKNKNKMDIWIEIFSESDDRWIACDIFKSKVDCVESLRKSATSPIAYVFAWNNNNTLKDVSARYCPQWNTVTRKLRVDQEWIDEAIKNYLGKKTARDTAEDRELHIMHLEKPLPTTISEYKNHPLYALERHLLKFEVIYPPNALTLGFVRGEPVYARECVHVCHSREIWLKSARVVKLGETPYKIVKARPKWDRMTQSVIKDQPLEIFGYWQTQRYEPPTAENGIVPRNAYGNVELFKKCMLPKKTVHLQLPGISRICKKLNIDCAPAVIGFDFHQGLCHPLLDGFVICEEFKDKVLDAWNREQEEAEKREEEKYNQRVYGNWKKLIKGLLIKQKLKLKYNF